MKSVIESSDLGFLPLNRVCPFYMIAEEWGRKRQAWISKEAILDWRGLARGGAEFFKPVVLILACTHIQLSEDFLYTNYSTYLAHKHFWLGILVCISFTVYLFGWGWKLGRGKYVDRSLQMGTGRVNICVPSAEENLNI